MQKGKLSESATDFAVAILQLTDELTSKKEYIISRQIGRSGTSIGANIYEANYASSRSDFINKLRIALKECNETLYWLILLQRTEKIDAERYQLLYKQCVAIRAMLVKSVNTAEKRE